MNKGTKSESMVSDKFVLKLHDFKAMLKGDSNDRWLRGRKKALIAVPYTI